MKLKRFFAVMLSTLLLATAFPMSALAATRTLTGMIDELETADDTQFIKNNEAALERLYEGYMNHSETINLYSFRIPSSSANALFFASIDIYPELFFVGKSCQSANWNGYIYSIKPTYLFSKDEVEEMLPEFYAKADEYLAYVDDSMDDFTKAVVLHDRLAINSAYSIYAPDGSGRYSNNYYFMIEGWGRCENYAECYAYLLAQEGIKSEIVGSDSMNHEWMKLRLDGSDYYYNIDLTWDDPLLNDNDRPGKVSHSYFLLSDEALQTVDNSTGRYKSHYDYEYINESGDKYDGYDKLHSLDLPLFYINGELYTVYEINNKGYLGTYSHADDTFDNKVEIEDIWHYQDTGYWIGNFSGIGEYNGLLYFNGENRVYVYDPASGEKFTYIENAVENQLYGLYVKDGKITCLSADTPNDTPEEVGLGDCIENVVYLKYGDSVQQVFTDSSEFVLPENPFSLPEDKVFGGWTDENGNTLAAGETIQLTPGKHSYTLNAKVLGIYNISIPESADGSVSVESETAVEGSEVALTVTPDELCRLASLTVTDENNTQIPVTDNKFIMPASNVTVNAVFYSPLKQSFETDSQSDANIMNFFPNQTVANYGSLELMGVQLRADAARGVRFVTVVNSEILASDLVEDYGYIFTLSDKSVSAALENVGNLNVDNSVHAYSCAGTYNAFCEGDYGSADFTSTEYKYVTAAVNDIPDNGATICARFYVKLKSGTVFYANYSVFSGCAFNFEENV